MGGFGLINNNILSQNTGIRILKTFSPSRSSSYPKYLGTPQVMTFIVGIKANKNNKLNFKHEIIVEREIDYFQVTAFDDT